MITVPAAIIMFLRDVWHDINTHRRKSEIKSRSAPSSPIQEHRSAGPLPAEVGETPQENDVIELSTFPTTIGTRKGSNVSVATIAAPPTSSERAPSSPFGLIRTFPTPITTLRRLPYPLLPFAFSMFILVQGLASTGWIAVFAGWWAAWARASGVIGVVGGMGFVSVCLCNLCGTNIGATILLARVIQVWEVLDTPSARDRHGAIYALALGSNYGAFSTVFSASLAGLLWRDILAQKGIIVRRSEFAKLNFLLVLVSMTVGCAVLVAQIYVRPPT